MKTANVNLILQLGGNKNVCTAVFFWIDQMRRGLLIPKHYIYTAFMRVDKLMGGGGTKPPAGAWGGGGGWLGRMSRINPWHHRMATRWLTPLSPCKIHSKLLSAPQLHLTSLPVYSGMRSFLHMSKNNGSSRKHRGRQRPLNLSSSLEIFKLLRSPGIDSKESIPPAYLA